MVLGVIDFFQKWTNKFDFTTMIPQVDLFSFDFWEKLKTPKRRFETNWPLRMPQTFGAIFLFVLTTFHNFCGLPLYVLNTRWTILTTFSITLYYSVNNLIWICNCSKSQIYSLLAKTMNSLLANIAFWFDKKW